ncbi:Na(+)/H(+) antiporter subunit D [Labeo rohita]|uniref:Na(+)/H(+) antiporter subunit D n=1 Tax=Labeo rohita TaxID=84645 RepID=A0ABQ8L4V8_LABRO|nr:Na(+)/H(+) antiporter subunit D [Labeo rohita]
MHSVLLGVARTVTGLWLNSENHEKHWYIGRSTKQIDELLLKIKPPCSVPRVPRSVTLRKFWKAHEWYMWLFYYSLPVLKGVLPEPLLNHWSKLVKGVSLLLGENITRDQITESEALLTDFVKDMEVYYGEDKMSFNVYLCLHLPRSVVNWGPLWAHSAFVFESYNAKLLDMIKSTQGVALQIVKTFWLQKALPFYGQTIMKDASNECKEIFETLTRPEQLKHVTRTRDITALDRPKVQLLRRDDYMALSRYRVQRSRVKYFQRIIANGEVFHSEDYSRVFKRNSFTVMLNDDDQHFFLALNDS